MPGNGDGINSCRCGRTRSECVCQSTFQPISQSIERHDPTLTLSLEYFDLSTLKIDSKTLSIKEKK